MRLSFLPYPIGRSRSKCDRWATVRTLVGTLTLVHLLDGPFAVGIRCWGAVVKFDLARHVLLERFEAVWWLLVRGFLEVRHGRGDSDEWTGTESNILRFDCCKNMNWQFCKYVIHFASFVNIISQSGMFIWFKCSQATYYAKCGPWICT